MNNFSSGLILLITILCSASSANWYASNGVLYNSGVSVTLKGVNWFGLETTARAPDGLWTSNVVNGQTIGHSITWFMNKIADLGFNAVRIPLSPESLKNNPTNYPTASWARLWDPTLTTGWLVLNSMLTQAKSSGLYVLLDYQTCNENQIGNNLPGLPTNCPGYTLNNWYQDLNTLATLAKSFPNVIGIDIFNEPHGCSWSTWREYAQGAIASIYNTNQNIVYFVEGIDGNVPGDGTGTNWGENLYYAGSQPVQPSGVPANKIVYSPHVYDVGDNDWEKCFGYLQGYNQNTVIVGEWGYNSKSSYDINTFAPNLISYLKTDSINSVFYWSVNGNDADLGYLSSADGTWCTVVSEKLTRFKGMGINPKSYITSTNPPSICN